jgi:capsid protein
MNEVPQAKQPLLDRLIGAISPRMGAERMAWRDFANTYRGGVDTRLSRPHTTTPSFPGQSIAQRLQLKEARERAREIDKNGSIGFGTLSREVDNVVADGLTLQAHTDNKDFNAEVEERWPEFVATCDITGMSEGAADYEQTLYRSGRRDGDVGEILTLDDAGNPKLQIIPSDLICNPQFRANSAKLRDGVEFDALGKPITFHILDVDEFGKRKWTPIASRDFVYAAHRTEAFQVRGETCFMRCFNEIDDLDRLIRGVGLAAWMATVFGIIFKEKNAGKNQQKLPWQTNSAGNAQRALTIEEGMVKYMAPEDEIVQVDAKQPLQQTPDWIRMMARLIGLPFDMPLELVLLDVSQANLSSLRGGLQQFYRACLKRRSKYIHGWDRKYQWWISKMTQLGKFSTAVPAKSWPHEFKPRGWQFTDPIVQAQAAQLEIDMGINSPQNVCDELGRDYETIVTQRKAALKMAGDLPQVFSTLTRDPMQNAPQGNKDGQNQD